MSIPGVTTTRLQLAMAALCGLSGGVAGVAIGLLILTVVGARLLVMRHDKAGRRVGSGKPSIGGVTPLLDAAAGRHAA
jgi:hypothetical protein